MFNCAVSLAGDYADIQGVKGLCSLTDLIIAADGGADNLIKAGIEPDWLIGDNDSAQVSLPDKTSQLIFPRDKDYTDGELAMSMALYLAESGKNINTQNSLLKELTAETRDLVAESLTNNFRRAKDISHLSFLILFPFGKRPDHSWTNILLAASLARSGALVYLGDGLTLVRIVAGKEPLQAVFPPQLLATSSLCEEKDTAFSAIPLDDNVRGFTLRGMKWDLEQADLSYNRARAVSNRPSDSGKIEPIFALESGTVMLMLTRAD